MWRTNQVSSCQVIAFAAGTLAAFPGAALWAQAVVGESLTTDSYQMVSGAHDRQGMWNCGAESLTQSNDTASISPDSVWCGNLKTNEETSLARGFVAPFDLMLKCVDFGISENIGGDAIVRVRILVGPISSAYSDLTLVSETEVFIADGTMLSLQSADIPDVQISAGTEFVVELNTPTRMASSGGDGGLLSFGTNTFGQTNATYLRADACGVTDFTDVTAFGFGDRNLVMSLGIDSVVAGIIEGGFPISAVGNAVLVASNEEIIALGSSAGPSFGVSVSYGTHTGGVGGSFRTIGDPADGGAVVSVSFAGQTQMDTLRFSDYLGDPSQAVLDLEFDDSAFDSFDVHVYNDGDLVGVIENQSSGTVVFRESLAGDNSLFRWLSRLFGGGTKSHCYSHRTYYENGNLKSRVRSYALETGTTSVAAIDGSGSFVGNEFRLIPHVESIGAQAPLFTEFTASGIPGIAVNVADDSPSVVIGDAQTNPSFNANGGLDTAQAGVSFTLNNAGLGTTLTAEDVDSDGLADLVVNGAAVSVEMQLGGVESASIAIGSEWGDTFCRLLSLSPVWDGGTTGKFPDGDIVFDRCHTLGDVVYVTPNLDFIGDGSYTMELYNDGQLVYSQGGMYGVAGEASEFPTRAGVFNEANQLGFSAEFPDQATFTVDGSGDIILADEIRTYVDESGSSDIVTGIVIILETKEKDGYAIFSQPVTTIASISSCLADLNGDGALNFFDVSAFLAAYSSQDPMADFNGDGNFDFFDVSAFLSAFADGCP